MCVRASPLLLRISLAVSERGPGLRTCVSAAAADDEEDGGDDDYDWDDEDYDWEGYDWEGGEED